MVEPGPAKMDFGRVAEFSFSSEEHSGIIHPDRCIMRNRHFRNHKSGRSMKGLEEITLRSEVRSLLSPYGYIEFILFPLGSDPNRFCIPDSMSQRQFQRGFRGMIRFQTD